MTHTSPRNDVAEARRRPRFNLRTPVPATFAGTPASVTNLSADGLGIEHSGPMKINAAGSIRIDSPENLADVAFRGRIRWSRLSKTADRDGRLLYHSGVQIEEASDASAGLLGRLIRAGGVADRDSLDRKRQAAAERLQARALAPVLLPRREIDDARSSQLHLIREAQMRLANQPESAQEWYNRAKYSMARRNLVAANGAPPYRRDVIVIWEYLGGKIDLDTITAALDGAE
jgi:hypothetical protein